MSLRSKLARQAKRTARPGVQPEPPRGWSNVERVSWVVGIVAGLATLVALWPTTAKQQERDQQELASRSKHSPPARDNEMDVAREMIARNATDATQAYRSLVAARVLSTNQEYMFTGHVPDLLPAILILSVEVKPDGAVGQVKVIRQPSQHFQAAIRIAERAIARAAPLPLPPGGGKPHIFNEIFLFRHDGRFTLDSLQP